MLSHRQYRLGSAVLLFTLLFPSSVLGQDKASAKNNDLIMMTATVRNRDDGGYVMGLNREAFEITDDKESRSIEVFENADSPVSTGILIDLSRSMQAFESTETSIGEAVSRFLRLSNAHNEYFVLAFDKSPQFIVDWTSGQGLLAQRMTIAARRIDTALYDACFAAIEKLQTAHYSKRALVLMSDGLDNASHHTFKELRELLRRSDVTLYGIGLRGKMDAGSSLGSEGKDIMEELALVTGGETLFSEDRSRLSQVIELFSNQLRHQYRIGFRSVKTDPPNKWHRLKLKIARGINLPLDVSKLTVRTRQGYYTP